jgi:pyruvate formate lyase activating enzyme
MDKENTGLVYLIQHYSLQDGPGLRTTVFLKGCPLSCRWCHNPESIRPHPDLMTRDRKCMLFADCVKVCPEGAITIEGDKRIVDRQKCTLCFNCVAACPTGALERIGEYVTVSQALAEIEKDEVFYRKSGGGVTISGGEPLQQWQFVRNLLKACKEKHYPTAIETSGFAKWEAFSAVLEYVDLLLFDIKHMDPKLHKEGTGVDNAIILANLRKVQAGKRIWLRLPLIAGYNDSLETFRREVDLAVEVHAEKISALPYHEYGIGKYGAMGMEYRCGDAQPPPDARLEEMRKISEAAGIAFTIGE